MSEESIMEAQGREDIVSGKMGIVVVFVGHDQLDVACRFLSLMAEEEGFAFVLNVHGSLKQMSGLSSRLASTLEMPVDVVEKQCRVLSGHVYIQSPLVGLEYRDGELKSIPRDPVRIAMGSSRDSLLASLLGSRTFAAVVLLPGCESTALGGLSAFMGGGGELFSTQAKSIPEKIRESLISCCFDLEALPTALRESFGKANRKLKETDADLEGPQIEALLHKIEAVTQVSFRQYKLPTIKRRIANRIKQLRLSGLDEYLVHVDEKPGELQSLYEDFMIGVTRFFRDPEAFDVLALNVIPRLFSKHSDGSEVRIWVPGSATGEEAYSLAILCDEYVRANPHVSPSFKIFATDAHEPSVEFGKAGFYDLDAIEELGSERVNRYFVRHNRHYQVSPELRRRVVFAIHNLLSDAPFTRVDFISCRNVLIYFNQEAQRKTIGLMLFALVKGGYLFLGPSESPNDHLDLLESSHGRWRIFKKRKDSQPLPLEIASKKILRKEVSNEPSLNRGMTSFRNLIDGLMERYMPDSLILDGRGMIVQTFGNCERYLSKLSGKVSLSYKENLVESLRMPLQLTIARALESKEVCRFEGCPVDDYSSVDLYVEPIPDSPDHQDTVHVVIKDNLSAPPVGTRKVDIASNVSKQEITALRKEVQDTKFQLQESIRQLEFSNNDLQVANEELMTSNEELQSTNEELQSVNEELFSVNSEFEQKNSDLVSLNEDINNLLQSTQIGTIFVDQSLRIRKFTPAASVAMHLLDSDIGRPMAHITHRFEDYSSLLDDTRKVIESGDSAEKEAKTKGGKWFLIRILAYEKDDGEVDGAVITFIDIEALKEAERYILENQRKLTLALEAADFGLWTWDLEHGMEQYDDRFYALLGLSKESEEERESFLNKIGFCPDQMDRFDVETIRGTFHHSWSVAVKSGELRYLCVRGIVYRDSQDRIQRVGGVLWDETSLKQQEQLILEKKNDLETLLYVISHDLREPLRAVRSFSKLLQDREADSLSGDSLDFLRRIKAGATRMSHLLDDVLDLSRIHNMETPTVLVSGQDLVDAALKPLESRVRECSAEVVISSDFPELKVNFLYAKQALYNLVNNALKFTKEGESPKVEISPYLDDASQQVGFVVRDRGPGVPEDCEDRIFKLFQRAVGRDVEGTGAGLAIVKQIAQKHGGDAWYEPRPDGGAKFTLSFAKS